MLSIIVRTAASLLLTLAVTRAVAAQTLHFECRVEHGVAFHFAEGDQSWQSAQASMDQPAFVVRRMTPDEIDRLPMGQAPNLWGAFYPDGTYARCVENSDQFICGTVTSHLILDQASLRFERFSGFDPMGRGMPNDKPAMIALGSCQVFSGEK